MKFYNRPVQLGDKRASTGAALAVTAHGQTFDITTESLTTAGVTAITYTVSNNRIGAFSKVIANVGYGTSTTGTPMIIKTVVTSGQVVFTIYNTHATAALNGTLKLTGFVTNPGDIINS